MKHWTNLTRLTAANQTFLENEKVIAFLRTTEDDDELVTDLINAAIDFVEGPDGIGVALRSSIWRMSFDAFPSNISIALAPVKSIEAITYLDAVGDVQTLDPDLYHVDVDQRPALVAFHHRPTTKAVPGAVKVEFTAGYETVPADLRQAMLLLVGHWFENREAALVGNVKTIPLGVDRILRKYRVAAFL